jgi:hypothetical protein
MPQQETAMTSLIGVAGACGGVAPILAYAASAAALADSAAPTLRQVLPKLAPIERGPGAAPMPLIDDMGLTLRGSLPLLVDKLGE